MQLYGTNFDKQMQARIGTDSINFEVISSEHAYLRIPTLLSKNDNITVSFYFQNVESEHKLLLPLIEIPTFSHTNSHDHESTTST